MSAKIVQAANGVLWASIRGKLAEAELAALQKAAADVVRQHGSVRILLVTEEFKGWQRGDDWGDVSFRAEYDPRIQKMAIVGEKMWEGLVLIFAAQGLRRFPIKYFRPNELSQAQAWLASSDRDPEQHQPDPERNVPIDYETQHND